MVLNSKGKTHPFPFGSVGCRDRDVANRSVEPYIEDLALELLSQLLVLGRELLRRYGNSPLEIARNAARLQAGPNQFCFSNRYKNNNEASKQASERT